MNKLPLEIEGAFELILPYSEDERGDFVKVLHADNFYENGLQYDFKESYYSTSNQNVIRGMHFQIPPNDHAKLVYAIHGEVTDVLLDLRTSSPTYLKYCSLSLGKDKHNAVYIPNGVAHGFAVRSKMAVLVYLTTTVYNKNSDTGILWNSFDFDWGIEQPIISDRDLGFLSLNEFNSPFNN